MIDRGTGRPVANIEGGEPVMVLSKNTYGNNREVTDELIFNSQQRNGARISAPWYNAPVQPINTGRIIPLMRNGGVATSGSTATAAGSSCLRQQP